MKQSCFLLMFCVYSIAAVSQEYEYNYNFFCNSAMPGNYFFSNASSTGNAFIESINGKLPVSESHFHTPGNALQLHYKNGTDGKWQVSIFRQQIRGMDHFKKVSFLSFWVLDTSNKPEKGLPAIQLMRKDSSLTTAFPIAVTKTKQWQQVIMATASVQNFNEANPGNIMGVVFSQLDTDNNEKRIYIDDIEFLPSVNGTTGPAVPIIIKASGYAAHVDIHWNSITDTSVHLVKIYRSSNGKDFTAVGVQQPYINRFADYTGNLIHKYFYKIAFLNRQYRETGLSAPVAVETKSMTDDEILTMVQEASFRYYWEGAEPNSGLARENIPGRQNMIATGAAGFGMMALIAGTERKFITRTESAARFLKIVQFLERAETFHGAYPHFIDGPTGKVETFFGKRDNGADLVETSFLMEGLLTARQYFSGDNANEQIIREKITAIWQKVEWDWFRQYPDSKFLYWHWSPDQAWVINHNLIGWNETMVTYLLAIASPMHSVPAAMYYSGWANQDSTGQEYRAAWGKTKDGSLYSNGNSYYGVKLDVGVSNGGPLFFTHYSFMGYDPHFITDKYTNYFINNQHIATINYRYCVENPKHYKGYGDSAWGLTASDGPFHYSADEPVPWQDYGKMAPTGSISSFPYLPEAAMKALKNYYFNDGKFLWGEYGFKDAFDLTNNWCSEIYMGLNQAPMVAMIENYRSGLLWNLFMSCPEIKNGLAKLNAETTRLKRQLN